ncbi:MAG TPA: carbamoyltransferase HypF [Thermoleophilia bacterium]|nr:carbamoyltransferase HypF [Thermoleophilia bacterium]
MSGQALSAARISVRGVVQGVGFRPFVYSLAVRYGLRGWVLNTSAGVEVLVEGPPDAVAAFCEALPGEAPPRSHIATYEVRAVPAGAAADGPEAGDAFVILESQADPDAYQLVSPDIATCEDCRHELFDPADRRHEYPFTNCTNCGPRFTIIEGLPYDRERTTMRRFPLCPACRREYEDPADRRFHAEPNACPVCGPRVRLLRLAGPGAGSGEEVELAAGAEGDPAGPIRAAAELLGAGEILAVKGLGGFHLACDATDGDAVRRLKLRKRRPDKPLAVMFAGVDELRRHCRVTSAEEALLASPEHPVVLLEWREIGPDGEPGPELGAGGRPQHDAFTDEEAPVDPEVAVRQRYLGAMLPYTPLHVLLLRAAGRPLVMTSGNLAEEPIVKGWEEIDRLTQVADAYLVHDREIAVRYDDSVALVRAERPRLIRRSRGYAPFPVTLPRSLPQTLAAGAELKNTFCLTRDANAFLSQHIGDLENLETLEHYEASIEVYRKLFRLDPEVVAYDLHPEYLATKYALALPQPEKVAVQHHHAHIAARLVEHGREEAVIGVSLDGLGYGDDGRLWGGEVLVCDLLGYRRVAHLEELPLPGGAAAITHPWRTGLGWSYALLGEEGLARATRLLGRRPDGPDEAERAAVVRQIERGVNVPLTTSSGRLFDAVAALAGVRHTISYEGQAAIELEMMASGQMLRAAGAAPYAWSLDGDPGAAASAPRAGAAEWAAARAAVARAASGLHLVPDVPLEPAPAVVRLAPLMAGVIADLEAGAAPGAVGARLHVTLAAVVLDLCRRVRAASGLTAVALSGGVFQNRLLADLCSDKLAGDGFQVLGAGLVPVNDGGVSLGQAAVAGYTVLERRGELA